MTPRSLLSSRSARLPARVKLVLLAMLGLVALVAPRSAHARENWGYVPSDEFKRGPVAEFGWRPAVVPLKSGVLPAVRTHVMLGARLTPHVVLGTMAHATLYMDKGQKPGLGLDVMFQFHVARGLYVRAGGGAISHIPIARDVLERTPGYGGQVGLGYAFRFEGKAKGALVLGADYDLRILPDKRRRGVLTAGLTFMFG